MVPLFGPDFVTLCYQPDDPAFGRMIIDRDVIHECTAAAEELRMSGGVGAGMAMSMQRTSHPSGRRVPNTPTSGAVGTAPWTPLRRPRKLVGEGDLYTESGYGTDTDTSEKYPSFADSAGGSNSEAAAWKTTAGAERLRHRAFLNNRATQQHHESADPRKSMASPPLPPAPLTPITPTCDASRERKRPLSGSDDYEGDEAEDDDEEDDDDDDDDDDSYLSDDNWPVEQQLTEQAAKGEVGAWSSVEARAAYTLMQLHVADAEMSKGTHPQD